MPPMRTGRPSMVVSKAISLVTKSVVIIAWAASFPPSKEAAATN
jgi:hypothetical protein